MSPRPTKSIGKQQALAEDLHQDVDVLRRRHAAEQDDVALGADLFGERPGAGDEGLAVLRVVGGDVDRREPAQRLDRDRGLDGAQAGVGRDDQGAAGGQRQVGLGRLRELERIGELAAKVEAADERERFTDRHALPAAQPHREVERGALREEHLRARSRAVGG